ncbi:MAG TPA: ATP-binding protein [Polyangiales bacterium]|nr:ATP-binding protein [Polyangiales bacterium]
MIKLLEKAGLALARADVTAPPEPPPGQLAGNTGEGHNLPTSPVFMLDLNESQADLQLGGSFDPAERFGWLIELRWVALFGIVGATVAAAWGLFPGVNWHVLAVAAAVAALYNATLARAHRAGRTETGPRAALTQALGDFLLLTVVLWASGGVRSPFIGYYAFHVALAGVLAGPRATLLAAAAALACGAFLALAEFVPELSISRWGVEGALGALTDVAAFTSTIAGIAYIVTHAAQELRDREEALARARDSAHLEYEVLSTTLNELDAGLEIVDANSMVVFKNRLAHKLVPQPSAGSKWHCPGHQGEHACERDESEMCPLNRSLELGETGRCRFAASVDGLERVYELHSLPLAASGKDQPKVMNLYVDRTGATLAERQLVLSERLSSLGRIAQGVAHELNTPLATIRTLAADMGVALDRLGDATDPEIPQVEDAAREVRDSLIADLGESAELIHEETGRLGRITHALLAGGDLVRARIDGSVTLSQVLERGCALVIAGARKSTHVDIDPSVEGITVEADPDRLVQVIVNLVQNACDAVRERLLGRVRILVTDEPEGMIAIRVEDNGPGIAPEVENRLFEPFATTKPSGEGTGLGLYTSYMLVRAMHGTLALENRREGGASAVVRLPRARESRSEPIQEVAS